MFLKDLIKWLKEQDASAVVLGGFGAPHIGRGDNSKIVFEPVEKTTICAMLHCALSARGQMFTRYNGGGHMMHEYAECRIGRRGEAGVDITEVHLRSWHRSIGFPVYDRFKHLDRWLESVPEDSEPIVLVARDLWRAIKDLAGVRQ